MIERETKTIQFSPFVAMCMQEGGYVAGGAARALFLRKNMEDYFQIGEHGPKETAFDIDTNMRVSFPIRSKTAGDVDVFFHSRAQFDAAVGRAKAERLAGELYSSALSKSFSVKAGKQSQTADNNITVQLIHCIFGPPEDMISGFDIVNSSVAVDQKGFIYDTEFLELEKSSTLKIRRGDATQLLRRVAKYMSYRGLTSLDDSTHDVITGWMLRYVSGDFVGPTSHLAGRPAEGLLGLLMKQGVVERDHLIYLLNRPEFIKNVIGSEGDGYKIIGRRDQISDLIGKSA
jgi:hypothetical protein